MVDVLMEQVSEDVQALLNLTEVFLCLDQCSTIWVLRKYYSDREGRTKIVTAPICRDAELETWRRAITIMLTQVENDQDRATPG